MTTPAQTRFSATSVYQAMQNFIERVKQHDTVTETTNHADQVFIFVFGDYASVMTCFNYRDELTICTDVRTKVLERTQLDLSDFVKKPPRQLFTTVQKTFDGPAELEPAIRKVLSLLALAKENHENPQA